MLMEFFFPVFSDEQPYVICFDLRKELIFSLDTSAEVNNHHIGSNYNVLCDILRSLLANFLKTSNEDLSSASVSKSSVKVVDISWAYENNAVDAALYVMRHMETFEGDTSVEWNSGLMNATDHHIAILRMRYCSTIVMWEKNKYNEEVLKDASTTYGLELAENETRFDRLLIG
ncbi:uncharacterized protein LOC131020310 [Salvia miltiorrhiza]|uniref:uncharacterized protein LOC131020310 n=1 Tax=Salvia miltiorrhiza TaxID=226208 RepID=UPI0025ACAA20|nr:uncharacterized protein LOC131020310 [Salvia miltiorrhiza]XP_057805026.1 uncharacterized protein LOC131020310 [Salvia miltiorrhiza]XP_057805027.1 uncharacterized protein LOC131020310 [Salvia miltiorrhiza]XP_057805028.1 uncharacterized protein LOC131020310 [Salvia miltiorrhiza]